MIDTHCHIYVSQLENDIEEVLDRAENVGISDILMPAIDFQSIRQMDKLSHSSIRFHKMAGIHPCEIGESISELAPKLEQEVHKSDIVGIGETGLDYYWSKDFIGNQKESLRIHCQLAKETGKPIVLHNRDSTLDLLEIIEEQQDGRLRGVWHCFTGNLDEGKRALDLNLMLGVGGVVTFKNAGVDKTVADLPLPSMILETDAPYLAPAPYRGKRNEPSYIRQTAIKLAEVKDCSLEEIMEVTTMNARSLFSMEA